MDKYERWSKNFAKKQGYRIEQGKNNLWEFKEDEEEPTPYEDYKDYATHYILKGRRLNYKQERFNT